MPDLEVTFDRAICRITARLLRYFALDLTWVQFRRVLEAPKAPGVGLLAQFLILPAVAFGIGIRRDGIERFVDSLTDRELRMVPVARPSVSVRHQEAAMQLAA